MRSLRPDRRGYFGEFGGRFVPETLVGPLEELARAYAKLSRRRSFRRRLRELLAHHGGRPTPLHHARSLSCHHGGARIYLKREDLVPTGSHKLNNALGQALLAVAMGRTRLVAETGCGRHGVATATAAALLGLECVIYMGAADAQCRRANVDRMRLLGASVRLSEMGSGRVDEALGEALSEWSSDAGRSHYVAASVLGPDPYPRMVADFQRVIGREATRQLRRQAGRAYPDLAVAAVGRGSSAIGVFAPFLGDSRVRLVGVEAGGRGAAPGEHAARFRSGSPGVLHGARTLVLQDEEGRVVAAHSVAAGLDHPALGPQHADLAARGRVEYTVASDEEALAAFHLLAATEGILPALGSAHALAEAGKHAAGLSANKILLVGLAARADEDLEIAAAWNAPSAAMAAAARHRAAADWSDAAEESDLPFAAESDAAEESEE